ncbi:ferredoxin-type protein NapF [Thalassotalea sp. LPB0316]|uniref:ferredoxin-type protein NapF n=1 Tax=Thalassotalea sp. LPB0316 TaxID=2769490 RepID=UPI001866B39A|nr:ferredoxin-type protein NapF [Thalassotalea sp. LPB0316]QOL26965.1 ferredoxin-type protein NapF [Thalassotalea sp. LPB0316]
MVESIDVARRRFFTAAANKEKPTTFRLPWSKSETNFTENCTQCKQCIAVCETSIIKRDRQGFPYVDFTVNECTFCQKCVEACDVDMFDDPDKTRPWQAELEITDKCLAKSNIYCQSCRDICDAQAIKFPLLANQVPQPEIIQQDCTACGACVSTCPQEAITLLQTESCYE